MNLTLSTAIAIGSIVAAATGAAIAGYKTYHQLEQKISPNTTFRLLQQYQINDLRSQKRELTPKEYIEFCASGKQLGIHDRCPSRRELRRRAP